MSQKRRTVDERGALWRCPDSQIVVGERIQNIGVEVVLELINDTWQNGAWCNKCKGSDGAVASTCKAKLRK